MSNLDAHKTEAFTGDRMMAFFPDSRTSPTVTAWTSCGSGNVCVCVNICMNDRALRAVKKLYIRLCAARNTNAQICRLPIGCHERIG
jgi:hypothetical protein